MPELPEVEVVRRSLSNFITGLKIKKVRIFNNNLRYTLSKNFQKNIEKQKITSISRRAKFLLIKLENKKIILIHLGMTGKIFIQNLTKKSTLITSFYFDEKFKKKHNHLIFYLNNSIGFIYNDVRRFGFIKIIKMGQIKSNEHLSKLGPEPLNSAFNNKYLISILKKTKKNIKNFMMDQKYIAGLGNIYVNEILFSSSIDPRKNANKLSKQEVAKIVSNTKKILIKSIQLGGSSIRDFNSVSGQKGKFQQKFMVYDRDNKFCRKMKCKGIIKKIYIGNRAAFFCQKCQK